MGVGNMSRHDNPKRKQSYGASAGFSLLELMIAVVVLAIGVGLAIPTFRDLIRSSNVSSTANDLQVAINLARIEAIKRGTRVAVMSKSTNSDWSTGWNIVVDSTRDGAYTGETVRTSNPVGLGYSVKVKASGAGGKDDRIVFDSSGALTNGLTPPDMTDSSKPVTKVEISVCSQITDMTKARTITVIPSGQTMAQRGVRSDKTAQPAC
jgi:type IV fimbrial biogenesis protein FimT